MCDYSLEMYASRPARESEEYVTTRFPSGSIGLASPGDCMTAVCVQYDTRLKLEGIPGGVQAMLGVSDSDRVVFARLDYRRYADGIRFTNHKEISLQLLGPGVRAALIPARENPHVSPERQKIVEAAA